MTRQPIKGAWFVVAKDGVLWLYTDEGQEVGNQIMIRVTDDVDCVAVALLKCVVNIASSEEDMKAQIELLKQQL